MGWPLIVALRLRFFYQEYAMLAQPDAMAAVTYLVYTLVSIALE